ncbi:family 43 glycosylhydrolase [Cryptosporangium minutisporangium]|uniref:Family 43 glycosylhydrolase n=1 Tax=Cryptosporangium minutisporangium TaxID=113569 RepID=A0ABP6SRY9_9ACTN
MSHPGMVRMICNPLDLPYRYQEIRPMLSGRTVHREAADPSIVRFRGRFYLFASMSRGFWHSADLVTWDYRPTEKLPPLDYAPDVREVDGALYISASRRDEPCPFFRSVDPLADDFVEVTPGAFPFWDPNLFQDDDGATYLYWGCDNKTPIYGTRIDPRTFAPIGDRVDLIAADTESRGWEQPGDDHVKQPPRTEMEKLIADYVGEGPFIEGAWMTRRGETYYLQYAAPGTEYNTYADGYFTGTGPLGPFTYSPHSPFSAKPGGFITGAGHGSTFQDQYGNWWHAATMRISVNHAFERRIGLFPAGFDDDGVLFCNQNFADYPMQVPDRRFDPWTEVSPAGMLLSYRSAATASSSLDEHGPELAVNENIRDWWVADSTEPGQWLRLDLGNLTTVHAVQVNLADHELAALAPETTDGRDPGHEYRGIYAASYPAELHVETSVDGRSWTTVHDGRGTGRDTPHLFATLDEPRRARYVRVTAGRLPFDGPLAISGLRVFGTGNGRPPADVAPRATRVDGRVARIEWDGVAGAQGYNVRYGLAPEKLYHSWLVYEQTDLDLRALNAGVDYWVAVDSFNENGITPGAPVPVTG